MKFLLGTKEGMSQVFAEDGTCYPVTVLTAGPCVVTQVKTLEKEGYTALQFGFGTKREALIPKPEKGHLKNLGAFRYLREARFTSDEASKFKIGDKVDVSLFLPGELVRLTGVSKGKGFQGVVKRHGFSGGSRTHGQKHSEREAGTIGGGGRGGGRVIKGMRMAGRMGGERITQKNVEVIKVDPARNELFIRGAAPGRRGSLVIISSSL